MELREEESGQAGWDHSWRVLGAMVKGVHLN